MRGPDNENLVVSLRDGRTVGYAVYGDPEGAPLLALHGAPACRLMFSIADKGGLIGVGFWDGAVCEASLAAVADAIGYAVGLLGADHVALGSDFDGAVTTPFDSAESAALVSALLDRGLDARTIGKVMGENQIAFFAAYLPD